MNPRNNFIACAEMAMKGHAQSHAEAAKAKTKERRDYWLAQAADDENRARFYLKRAQEFDEITNEEAA
jgi:hypothetical protein